MADYHAILKRAISQLSSPTGEARRAVYEKARTALVNQLRSFDPPLGASEITQQRLHLEDAIRKVESEVAKGLIRPKSAEPPPPPPAAPVPAVEAAPAVSPAPVVEAAAPSPRPPEATPPAAEPSEARAAEPARPPRELFAADEPPPPTFGREAGHQPTLRPKKSRRKATGPQNGEPAKRSRLPVAVGVAVAVLVVGIGVVALWSQREAISAFFGSNRAPVVDLAARANSEQLAPKVTDRIVTEEPAKPAAGTAKPVPTQTITATPQLQSSEPPKPADSLPVQQAVPLVAQSAILYEEGKGGGQAQISSGKVVWQTQPDPTDPRPGALLLKARVEIPDRNLVVLLQMHPNGDTSFPASHMVEIKFNPPPDFEGKMITSVPGIILKTSEQARGDALSGASAKVSENFFWIALSATEADKARNLRLFRERGWIDVPVLYETGRRAILTIEKGTAGEHAVSDAFASWGQAG